MRTRKEIVGKQRNKYKKSTKKGKGAILDTVCAATGLSRDRAQRILNGNDELHRKAGRSGRNPKYGQSVRTALEKVWVLMNCPGGRNLCAGMPDILDALSRFGECGFDENTKGLLLEMSHATADRLLKRIREKTRLRGVSTTKPGTLLKRDIPIRTGTEWDDAVPGFVEIDLVAHCGATTAGDYVNTLDATDVCSGWTETRAVVNKAQTHTFKALKSIEKKLPFPLLGIDSDNGVEFINNELMRYCRDNDIAFTRSRPYMKNDSCYVEQKNWHTVRRNIGYARYEGREAVRIMNAYYSRLRLYTNFFIPQTKLLSKNRSGARVIKRYENPVTPYRRLLADGNMSPDEKERLTETFISLNPAALKRDMMKLLDSLMKLAMPG
jgi:hypothetical protein